ncbi:MAG: NADH-quinone oxidoreductase subunit C, partial [Candidatus Omnitrophica bacterium]|nr:NADH-quinone oxidoreductase subunit C [Candidatus Omnitrophota bacterium]
MNGEEKVQKELIEKFGFLQDRVRITRPRRILADVEAQNFRPVFDYAIDKLGFSILCAITGLDETEMFGLIYHIAKVDGTILSLKTCAPKTDPAIKTVTDRFPAADIYEREIMDLLGIKVEGLAAGNRYPLADDWPKDEFPLRKDWKSK